jgi:hypothetical protein
VLLTGDRIAVLAATLPNVVTAIAWVALTAVHVMRRRRLYVGLLRSAGSRAPGRRRRVLTTTALIGCAVIVTVSGFAQWAGFAAATPWHAGSSTLLIGLAAVHVAIRLWRTQRKRDSLPEQSPIAHPSSLTTSSLSLFRVVRATVGYRCGVAKHPISCKQHTLAGHRQQRDRSHVFLGTRRSQRKE